MVYKCSNYFDNMKCLLDTQLPIVSRTVFYLKDMIIRSTLNWCPNSFCNQVLEHPGHFINFCWNMTNMYSNGLTSKHSGDIFSKILKSQIIWILLRGSKMYEIFFNFKISLTKILHILFCPKKFLFIVKQAWNYMAVRR